MIPEAQLNASSMMCNGELEQLTGGQYVEVFGLQSQTGRQMNKQKGTVIKALPETGRIEVCLGPEGKIVSLKPENLRHVPGVSAEELQDAKDVAGPALRAAQQESGAAPTDDIIHDAAAPSPPERERSRSVSPPPETVRAASQAGQQASGAAMAQGLSIDQAEAAGAAAAAEFLMRAKQEAKLQRQQGGQPAAEEVLIPAKAATVEKKPCSSLEDLKVGDSVKVVGLKGKDEELNGETFVVDNFRGWGGPAKRKYVVSTTRLIIDAAGDPAEEKKVLTVPGKNIRMPGDDAPYVESCSSSSSSSSRARKRSKRKRSRSRRRSRSRKPRSRSPNAPQARGRSRERNAPAMSKADKLKRFGFLTTKQQG